MKDRSDVTNIDFEIEDCVFFRNITQSIFYIEHGCKIIDLFVDSNHKLVFVFLKSDHKKVIDLWMKNKENNLSR